jgi:hypothetical protein
MPGIHILVRGCPKLRHLEIGVDVPDSLVPVAAAVFAKSNTLLILNINSYTPNALAQAVAEETGGRMILQSTFQGLVDLELPLAAERIRDNTKTLIENCLLEDPCVFNEWKDLDVSSDGSAEELAGTSTTSSTSSSAPTTSTTCSWPGCRNKDGSSSNLQVCSRCKIAASCSTECQKKHWEMHKNRCSAPDVPRHEVEDFTIEAIQSAIDKASPGDIMLLKDGSYEGSAGPRAKLIIDKPLRIWGPEFDKVKLKCDLVIKPSEFGQDGKDVVILSNFEVYGTGTVMKNTYKGITFCIRVKCELNGEDALTINECKGKCLLLDCEIHGGSDGIFICTDKVHLKGTEVRFAANRGIFAKVPFVIEESEVSSCGGYGIKGRCGWTEKGRHDDIQPGPWGADGPMSSGGFTF